ncbi:MAG: tetratricopeptide repeat protein [Candidatus Sumerlaeaceae bacterium]
MTYGNRKRDLLFTLATLVAMVANVAGAVLNYVLWSDGLVLHDLYTSLVELAGPVAAALFFSCTTVSALAYALGLDPMRPKRPHVRTWLLVTSYFSFLGGYFLGRWQVNLDNVVAVGIAAFVVVALASAWVWAEGVLGRLFIKLARQALDNAPATIAYWWAKIGLMLCPSHRIGENILALSLARLGKCMGADRYLLQAYEDGERDADLCNVLGQLAECQGDLKRAADFYEEAHHLSPSTALFRKLIALWEKTGQKRKALEALQKLHVNERHHWAEHICELTFEVGSFEEIKALCKEYEHDGPPFTRAKEAYLRALRHHPRDRSLLEALADLAHRTNELELEKESLLQLIQLFPNETGYRRRLIEILRWQGRLDEILAQLDFLIDLGDATREERLEAANEHFARANYDRVEQIIASSPALEHSMEAGWLLAYSYFEQGRIPEAQKQAQRAEKLPEDNSPEVRARLTSLQHRIREFLLDQELEELSRKVEQTPDDLELRFQLYDRLTARGNADRVVVALEELLHGRPELLEHVMREVEKLVERYGHTSRLMAYLADLYLRQHKWDEVFKLYQILSEETIAGAHVLLEGAQKILHENPHHLPSLLFLAQNAAEAGRNESALNYLDRYVAAGGEKNATVLRLEFELALSLGLEDRARDAGYELLKIDSSNKPLLVTLAQLAAKRKQFSEALALAVRAQALDPGDPAVRELVKNYQEKERRARIEELRNSLTNDPEKDGLVHLELGDIYHDLGQLNDAIVEYQKATLAPDSSNVAAAKLGYVLAFKGLYDDARDMLSRVQLSPKDRSDEAAKLKALLYRAAELMEKDGEIAAALQTFKRIFHVDAGYRDVVAKIEKLQRMQKK